MRRLGQEPGNNPPFAVAKGLFAVHFEDIVNGQAGCVLNFRVSIDESHSDLSCQTPTYGAFT